ncbi:RNA ligase [Sphingomonas bacterium]|uniref:RNA ligase n=1 Tax=Sphingomonas bacterium TaxID=1895847 RepID=UPI0015759029|nr:RNA ligase [Sphingomonas bacterium]
MTPHYARTIPLAQLEAELHAARAERVVYWKDDGPLRLWCYTAKAVYDRAWAPAVLAARGLVIDRELGQVVATAFPKFFNVGELGQPVPDEPCEIFEKVDGSLIVIFHAGGRWRTATKGALDSAQAKWAQARLAAQDLSPLTPGTTYLAEAIYPENKIIIPYEETGLVMLAAYAADGLELDSVAVRATADALGWRTAARQAFASPAAAIAHADTLPKSAEGYVLRFASGLRLKAKGAAYRRLHAMISRVTPLGLWDATAAGDDLDGLRREIPEEFWWDFDEIRRLIEAELAARVAAVAAAGAGLAALSDKEVGLRLPTLAEPVRRYVFAWRKRPDLLADAKSRQALLRDVKPRANELPGYRASFAVQRLAEEE